MSAARLGLLAPLVFAGAVAAQAGDAAGRVMLQVSCPCSGGVRSMKVKPVRIWVIHAFFEAFITIS